jgi:hypothetical protein
MVDAQMRLQIAHRYDAVERWRACDFYGHHVAKIRTKKRGSRSRPFLMEQSKTIKRSTELL